MQENFVKTAENQDRQALSAISAAGYPKTHQIRLSSVLNAETRLTKMIKCNLIQRTYPKIQKLFIKAKKIYNIVLILS